MERKLCYHLPMSTTTNENSAPPERAAAERPTPERKEPTYLFTEKYVADKSETARRFPTRVNASTPTWTKPTICS